MEWAARGRCEGEHRARLAADKGTVFLSREGHKRWAVVKAAGSQYHLEEGEGGHGGWWEVVL